MTQNAMYNLVTLWNSEDGLNKGLTEMMQFVNGLMYTKNRHGTR
jgi:hypothetical protein